MKQQRLGTTKPEQETTPQKDTKNSLRSDAAWGTKFLTVAVLILSVALLLESVPKLFDESTVANPEEVGSGRSVVGSLNSSQVPNAKPTTIRPEGTTAASAWVVNTARTPQMNTTLAQVAPSTISTARLEAPATAQSSLASASLAEADDSDRQTILAKLSPDLRQIDPSRNLDVIVQFKHSHSEAQHQMLQARGATQKAELDLINADLVHVRASTLEALAGDPEVVHISPDRQLKGSQAPVSGVNTPLPAGPVIRSDIVWQTSWSGNDVGVAVIDSGVTSTADLSMDGRLVYSENFVSGSSTKSDLNGHGTYMAGLVAGNGRLSAGQYKGIDPKALIINLRVLNQDGLGTDSAVIAAINRAIQLRPAYSIRVINLSLGRPIYESYKTDPLCQAVEAAWKNGIAVVVAAGNGGRDNYSQMQGYGTITSPGNDPYVITVGAMKTQGTLSRTDHLIASYSSKGPTAVDHIVKPDLVAPGNLIISVAAPGSQLALKYPGNLVGSSYMQLSGTSGAAAVASGAAAMLFEKEPRLTPDQVKAVLLKTASKTFPTSSVAIEPSTGQEFVSYYDIFTIGAGYLDLAAAMASVNDAQYVYGSATSPTAVYDPQTGKVFIVTDQAVVWGTAVAWGTGVVWGTNTIVNGTAVVWGSSVVWGTSTTQGFSVVWGSSVVWGTNRIAATSEDIEIEGDRN